MVVGARGGGSGGASWDWSLPSPVPRSVITIGNFDGVHAGHVALVRRARAIAGEGGDTVVVTFDPHPVTVLRPGVTREKLCPFERRVELLREAGADEVVAIEPTREFLSQSAEAFVRTMVEAHHPVAIVEGRDFHFGRGREGDLAMLAMLGERHGFGVECVEPVATALGDQTIVTCSSTMARWLVGHGRVLDAWAVLGRPFEIEGEVVRGDRRGRTLGMPTVNIAPRAMLPADGVYAGIARAPNGREYAAAISVGTKPTFNDTPERTAEAFLVDMDDPEPIEFSVDSARQWRALPGLDEYGWMLRMQVVGWVREQARFVDVGALCAQMERDVRRVIEIAADRTNPELVA